VQQRNRYLLLSVFRYRKVNLCLVLALLIGATPALSDALKLLSNRAAVYTFGPGDMVSVRVVDVDEFAPQSLPPVRIDDHGDMRLPIVGRIHAAGMTGPQMEDVISKSLLKVMKDPDVTVALVEAKSHPISVLGAVRNPGVYQITGRETIVEVLSAAGGLSPEAGNSVRITRPARFGTLQLTNVSLDPSGEFYVGELNLRALMDAKEPKENIDLVSDDVVTVPKADLVYVVGAVQRPGGFVLNEKEHISVLQALALAQGLDHLAAAKNARILHQAESGGERSELPVNLQRILAGQAKDVSLAANDILFVPTSATKNAAVRTLETAIQLGTGIAIYRR
jgi:polysaccharide biosynthesis/export protein